MEALIFDSHAHYNDKAFDTDREALLNSLPALGVCGVIDCGTSLSGSRASARLAEQYPYLFAAAGIHPEDTPDAQDGDLAGIAALLSHPKVVAIGEIGLDYHWDIPRPLQQDWLERQLALAKETDMPVILHDREAHSDLLETVRKYRPAGVVHCFSGSVELAQEFVKLGLYIGLGGAATFKNARKPLEVAAAVAPDRLLVETDCPYMTPVPFRGKRNDSSLIPHTALRIAQARGCTQEDVLRMTKENAMRLFQIP